MGLGRQPVALIIQTNQAKAKQRLAVQVIDLLHLLLHQCPRCRLRFVKPAKVKQRHRHRHRPGKSLQGQPISAGARQQYRAQGIVARDQTIQRRLHQGLIQRAIQLYVSANVVHR